MIATGCNLQSGGAGPQTWIDAPLDGMTLPLGPVLVRSHAASQGGTAQVALTVNGAEVRVDQAADGSAALVEFVQNWTPSVPGDYLLQVISSDQAGNLGRSNIVHVHIGELEITVTPTIGVPGITPLPIIPEPPSVTPSATGLSVPIFSFDKNGNCREGPSTQYAVTTSFLAGQKIPIDGRNEDSSWFWLLVPGGGHCWASIGTGVALGPVGSLTVVVPIPLPVATTPVPLSPPPAPGNFNVQELECTSENYTLRLVWQDVAGEDGYNIYRDGGLINTLSANTQSYDDASPDYSPHAYRVEAFNGSGTGSTGSKSSAGCVY
jgi:hypothetical protein